MPFRVRPDGTIVTDTAREALDLQELILMRSAVRPRAVGAGGPAATAPATRNLASVPEEPSSLPGETTMPDRVQFMLNRLSPTQRRLFSVLYDTPQGITDLKVRELFDIGSGKGLGGFLGSITTHAQRAGLVLKDVIDRREMVAAFEPGHPRVTVFTLTPVAREVLDKQLGGAPPVEEGDTA